MRTIEEIDAELKAAKQELGKAEGTPAEVYSRIVGYYRSVRNWNRGKREEYAERKLFEVNADAERVLDFAEKKAGARVKLFVRTSCPACPSAKEAAARLGVPVEYVDADTAEGLSDAQKFEVYSTPTAILLDCSGREIRRARDARGIAEFGAVQEFAQAASQ
jgi:ribonucleoside-triphosphate reductase